MYMKKIKFLLSIILTLSLVLGNFTINLAAMSNKLDSKINYKLSRKSDKLPFKVPKIEAKIPKLATGEVEYEYKILKEEKVKKNGKEIKQYKLKTSAVATISLTNYSDSNKKQSVISLGNNIVYAGSVNIPGSRAHTIRAEIFFYFDVSETASGVTCYKLTSQKTRFDRNTILYTIDDCEAAYNWLGPDQDGYPFEARNFTSFNTPQWIGDCYETDWEWVDSSHFDPFDQYCTGGLYNSTGSTAKVYKYTSGEYIGEVTVNFSFDQA